MRSLSWIALFAVGALGCQFQSSAKGQATFARPADEGGEPVPPQQNRDDLKLTISIEGSGAWSLLEGSACAFTQGDLSGSAEASGNVRSGGSYVSAFSTAEGEFNSPLSILCDSLSDVAFDAVADLTITATIPASQENCDGFCQAKAAADCEGDPDQATCEADTEATCQTDCGNAQQISGRGAISADALATLNGKLGGRGNIKANVDLVFDTLE
jgi:hypothetical protein